MVEIELYRRENDDCLAGFRARGHTGFAAAGSDVVCSAVSVLTTVTVLGLQARLQLSPDVEVDDDQGYLHCRLRPEGIEPDLWLRAQDLFETLALGLKEIAREYTEYVQVKEVAV